MNMRKGFIFIFLMLFFNSCSTTSNRNNKLFLELLSREQYMYSQESNRVFNPGPAMLISTLPDKIGNFKSFGDVNDFEVNNNGAGYSKRYINSKIKNGYWIDVFTYSMRQPTISDDINDEIVKSVYNNLKQDTLNSHRNSKVLDEYTLVFTTPDGKILKMKEMVFEYYDFEKNTKVRSYLYFGTSLDSFYKIRISYNTNLDDENYLFQEKENFVKDFGYYYTDGMSLNDFNKFKNSGIKNPIKMQRIN